MSRIAAILRREEVRYLLVAGTTAVFYLALVSIFFLWLGLHYFVAILIAQAITILSAFPFYRRFVFHSHSAIWGDFVRFLSVWLSGMVAGLVLTPFLVEILSWNPLIAQVFAIGLISVVSFLGHRFFSFGRSRDSKK